MKISDIETFVKREEEPVTVTITVTKPERKVLLDFLHEKRKVVKRNLNVENLRPGRRDANRKLRDIIAGLIEKLMI